MKFSPKCKTKSEIGKFVIKFGNFLSIWKKKTGAIYRPQIYPRKIPVIMAVFSIFLNLKVCCHGCLFDFLEPEGML